MMVNFIIHMMLLYAKQLAEYLLLMRASIVFKFSVQMANSCLNLVQKDQKMDNSKIHMV
jgi:hypothetical protein